MAYVYAAVDDLEGKPLVGSHHCVALVQQYAKAPQTSLWSKGELVKTTNNLAKGTAIATFVDGVYPNNLTGNHAALFLSLESDGINVMDQWKGDSAKPTISSRKIRFKGMKDGKLITPLSNNGDAYYVID